MPRLVPSAFAARSGGDLLLMDTRGDGYALISDAVADAASIGRMLWPLGVRITEATAAALFEAGMVEEGIADPSPVLEPPRTSHHTRPSESRMPRMRDVFDLVCALGGARRRLARGLPCTTYRRERAGGTGTSSGLDAALAGILAARLVIPTPARCLPASLIVMLFLARRGIRSELVFGVRTHPFAAHCWVEIDGTLVDDELDRVQAYHPICVGDV